MGRRVLVVAMTVAGSVVAGCAPNQSPPTPDPDVIAPGTAALTITTGDRSEMLTLHDPVPITTVGSGRPADTGTAEIGTVIDVDPAQQFQTIDGAGAAMTESAAHVIVSRLDATTRTQVVNDLFGRRGAAMSVVRVPLSSSDFSLTDHTYDDTDDPGGDPTLVAFSLAPSDAEVVPLLRSAHLANPSLTVIGSAWSAPGWMKADAADGRNGVIGGTLASDMAPTYARYLGRVVDAFAARGVNVDVLTMQNEPTYAPSGYAGMTLTARQEADLTAAVGSEFAEHGRTTRLVVHDDNWNSWQRAVEVASDPVATPYVDGLAFHCYRGDVSAQTSAHDAVGAVLPDAGIYFTECSGTTSLGTFDSNLLWNARVLMIGAVRNWARTVVLWNAALDEASGPRVGGCSNCRGVLTIHPDGHVTRNEEFYALAQFGRGVLPGAVRIGSSEAVGGVSNVAVVNPDGTHAMVLASTAATPDTVTVRDGADRITITLPARSVATLRWHPSDVPAGD